MSCKKTSSAASLLSRVSFLHLARYNLSLQNSYSFLLLCHSQTAHCYHMLHYSLEEPDELFPMSVRIFVSIQFKCELHYDLVSTPSPVYFPLTFSLSNFISTNDHRNCELLEFSQFETYLVGEIQSIQ